MSKFSRPTPKAPVISEETALVELNKIQDVYDIWPEDISDNDSRKATEEALNIVLKGIMKGDFSVEDSSGSLKITQHLTRKSDKSNIEKITYREMEFSDHVSMKKDSSNYGRMCELLSNMAEGSAEKLLIKKLRGRDAKNAEALSLLFL